MDKDLIVIAGGAGYIGSCCARMLHGQGRRVAVLDDLSSGHARAVEGLPFERVDLLDVPALDRAFASCPGVSEVMLFAGRISVPESVRDPEAYYLNNLVGAHNLIKAMLDHGAERIVFSSSAAVYGVPDRVPIPEDAALRPISPYGRTKKQLEEALDDLAAAGRLRYASLRYFNASGAEPDGLHGEDHRPETHLIPLAVAAGLGRRPPLKVFGDDYDTPDGSCVRDYVHVRDLARAHLMALERLRKGQGKGDVFNLGCGMGASVLEVLRAVSRALGTDVPFEIAPRRPGDPPRLVASAAKIRRETGWEPAFDLDGIVETAVAWHRNHPDGYGPEEVAP